MITFEPENKKDQKDSGTMKIFLIGYMGSGKSRLGQELASAMGLAFLDLDDLFEERYRISILDFFSKYGEEPFRNMEHDVLHGTLQDDNAVISTGGGTPCFSDNMEFIKRTGISFYLKQEPGLLADRLRTIRKKRPLLRDIPPGDLQDYIASQLSDREVYYLQADHVLSGKEISVEKIVELARLHF